MEILALIEENAMQIICSVAVIISIIAGKTKTAEQAKAKKKKFLPNWKKKESKQVASLQKTLKKQAEFEEKGEQ